MPAAATQKAGSSDRQLKNTTTTSEATKTEAKSTGGSSKPDQNTYNQEQEKIKKSIDEVTKKLNAVKEKISPGAKGGPQAERYAELRAELDSIRGEQSNNKQSREKLFEQLKALNEGVNKRNQELNAAKAKIPFKSVAEVDEQIKKLEKQVESGTLKLAEEKRTLQEISQIKRSRRAVEGFEATRQAIDADRARADELRKQLDDPKSKAASERYDAIKSQLDGIKKEGDEAYANRNKLYEERNQLQAELDGLYDQKRQSAQTYREATDAYWQGVREGRAKRMERARLQREAEEAEKKKEIADRLLEEARIPAYQASIEDCKTLIDFFIGKIGGVTPTTATPTSSVAELSGVPKLELRQVEEDMKGMVPLKKKGEDEGSYFVAKTKKKGGKPAANGSKAAEDVTSPPTLTVETKLQVPLPKLAALMTLSIPPPTSNADLPRTVEDLKKKKAWFEANQARQTKENIAKAEAEVARLEKLQLDDETTLEPEPTPAAETDLATAVDSNVMDEKLGQEVTA